MTIRRRPTVASASIAVLALLVAAPGLARAGDPAEHYQRSYDLEASGEPARALLDRLLRRDADVLGRHARISVVGEELRLDVLGTAPGSDVYLNGAIVRTAALASGDRIQIGEATITLLNGPAPNPNRISAPPPRGRDALSVAAAALAPPPPVPPPAPPTAPLATS